MKNYNEQFELDLDPQSESKPILQESEPEVVPLPSEEERLCPQCEIFGGKCPRCSPSSRSIHLAPKPPYRTLSRRELDAINAELMLRPLKKDPPLTPEEIEDFFIQTKEELGSSDERRVS